MGNSDNYRKILIIIGKFWWPSENSDDHRKIWKILKIIGKFSKLSEISIFTEKFWESSENSDNYRKILIIIGKSENHRKILIIIGKFERFLENSDNHRKIPMIIGKFWWSENSDDHRKILMVIGKFWSGKFWQQFNNQTILATMLLRQQSWKSWQHATIRKFYSANNRKVLTKVGKSWYYIQSEKYHDKGKNRQHSCRNAEHILTTTRYFWHSLQQPEMSQESENADNN